MPFKYQIAKLEDVPENVRALYRPEGSVFVLDAEDVVPKARLDEFRTNNIQMQQQLDKLKNVDPVKYAELIKLQQDVEEGRLIKEGKLEEVVALRVTNMKRDLEGQLTISTTALSQANAQLAVLMIDNAVRQAAVKNGALTTALDDVVLRARTVYSMDNGQPVPKDGKGQVIYGKDGTTPMTVEDWLVGLKKSAPHLFAGSQGGGAGGGRGAPAGSELAKMTPSQKISYGLTNGMTALPNLPGAS
jgi:hypothetical protein